MITVIVSICGVGVMVQGAHSAQDVVPLFTPALEERLHPRCPKGCEQDAPFTAAYQQGRPTLGFVAVRNEFSTTNRTIRAVDAGFEPEPPAIWISKGFPL